MRKPLWIVPVLLLTTIVSAPCARADSYAISFQGVGAPTVIGSDVLTYDTSTLSVTAPATLEILYDGIEYAFYLNNTNEIVDPTTDSLSWEMSGFDYTIYDNSDGYILYDTGSIVPATVSGSGDATLTPLATPEPGILSLTLLGLGLVLVMRKGLAHGLPKAT